MSAAVCMVLRPFSDESLPIMLSKPIIPFGTSLKKSKKRQAIASAGSEALGSPGEAWDASGLPKQGSGAALGGF